MADKDQKILIVFKIAIQSACHSSGVPFGYFCRQRGLNDFLIDTDFDNLDPREIAADALDYLCDRSLNHLDQAVCLAVVDFLDETIGPPKENISQAMRLKALGDILVNPGVRGEYVKWAKSWYD